MIFLFVVCKSKEFIKWSVGKIVTFCQIISNPLVIQAFILNHEKTKKVVLFATI